MLRTTLIATACAAGFLSAPVAAHAATVSVDGSKV